MRFIYQLSLTVISLHCRYSAGVMPSTDRSFVLTLTYSQKPGEGLMAKAMWGGTTAASCKLTDIISTRNSVQELSTHKQHIMPEWCTGCIPAILPVTVSFQYCPRSLAPSLPSNGEVSSTAFLSLCTWQNTSSCGIGFVLRPPACYQPLILIASMLVRWMPLYVLRLSSYKGKIEFMGNLKIFLEFIDGVQRDIRVQSLHWIILAWWMV